MLTKASLRLNMAYYMADMFLFSLAVSFMDPSTVVPDFVGQTLSQPVLIELSGIWFTLCWRLPQLIFAPIVSNSPNKRGWMLWSSAPGRFIFVIMAALTMLIGKSSPVLTLIVFFGCYGFFAICDGIASAAWVAMIGNTFPPHTRGLMFGASQIVTGIAVLGVQGLLRALLGPNGPGYPTNFALVFLIVGILLTLTLPIILQFYERPMPPPSRVLGFSGYLPYLGRIVRRDAPLRHFLLMRFFQDASLLAAPLYVSYEEKALNVPEAQTVSDSLIAVMVGTLIGSALGGWLGHRFTSRAVIYAQTLAILIGPIAALLSLSLGRNALLVSFVMIGLFNSAGGAGAFNWLVSYSPPEDRPVYYSIANTFGLLALAVPVIGGLLLEVTSYTALFVVALIIACLAGLSVTRLRKPPPDIPEPGAV